MKRAATLLGLVLVLGLSLVAAGCGGDEEETTGGETTAATTGALRAGGAGT